jgi:hypothetical protein
MRKFFMEKAGNLRHPPNYIRHSQGAEPELRALGTSFIRNSINSMITDMEKYVLEGNRRLAGVMLVGGPDTLVPICMTDEPMSDSLRLEVMLESSIHTRPLSHYEQYLGASEWLKCNNGATAKTLANKLGFDAGNLSKILSLEKGIPAVHEAAKKELLNATVWHLICTLPPEQQASALALRLGGATREEIAQHVRKQKRSGHVEKLEEKVSRARLALPGGTVITVAAEGDGLTVSGIIESLTAVLSACRAAEKEGISAKSLQLALKDKAQAKSE